MKFIRKPATIEAHQWFYGDDIKIEGVVYEPMPESGLHLMPAYIETFMGRVFLKEGDWVIRDEEGSIYVCNANTFEKIYQKVDE
jgi:hypothetical protein